MVCEHLVAIEHALIDSDAREIARGELWSRNCHEWVYFDVVLDIAALRQRFVLAECVELHENRDPRSGLERGFICMACHDAVMGRIDNAPTFP